MEDRSKLQLQEKRREDAEKRIKERRNIDPGSDGVVDCVDCV